MKPAYALSGLYNEKLEGVVGRHRAAVAGPGGPPVSTVQAHPVPRCSEHSLGYIDGPSTTGEPSALTRRVMEAAKPSHVCR